MVEFQTFGLFLHTVLFGMESTKLWTLFEGGLGEEGSKLLKLITEYVEVAVSRGGTHSTCIAWLSFKSNAMRVN